MVVLLRCFSYNPDDTFSNVFLLVTLPMLVLVRRFSCNIDANFSEDHASLIRLMQVLMSLYYSHHASFSQVFLLHSPY